MIETVEQDNSKDVHRWLSPLDWRFREMASRDPACLRRSTFGVLDQPNPLLRYSPQSWPTFMDRSRVRELAQISVRLSRMIRSLPARIFDHDLERMARFYDLDEPSVRGMLAPPDGIAGALSRGDFVYGPRGFQCVEFNMTTNLGGWATAPVSKMLLSVPPVAHFVAESGVAISHRSPLRHMLRHVLAEAQRDGLLDGSEFNLLVGTRQAEAMTGDAQVPQFLGRQLELVMGRRAPGLRGNVSICNYADLTLREGALYDGPRRLHSVLEYHVEGSDETVLSCFKAGALNLYNGPVGTILTDKRNLALLSEMAESDRCLPAERRLIADHLPWSRRIVPGEIHFGGEWAPIADLLRREPWRFVIKKARAVGGVKVAIGRFSAADAWEAAVTTALAEGDWIAQEYVESLPFLFQAGEHGCQPHDVVWGPYVFGDGYAGTILKVQPQGLGGIVNLWRGATEGILFEVDDGTPEPA
jgi:hypothetical protein